MLDDAFAEIAGLVSEAVGGPYHAATLTYPGTPVKDDGGSIITPGTTVVVACKAQVSVVGLNAKNFLIETDDLLPYRDTYHFKAPAIATIGARAYAAIK